jgi:hypothetical protein
MGKSTGDVYQRALDEMKEEKKLPEKWATRRFIYRDPESSCRFKESRP